MSENSKKVAPSDALFFFFDKQSKQSGDMKFKLTVKTRQNDIKTELMTNPRQTDKKKPHCRWFGVILIPLGPHGIKTNGC